MENIYLFLFHLFKIQFIYTKNFPFNITHILYVHNNIFIKHLYSIEERISIRG